MLQIDSLHKRYDDIVALDGCSFVAEPGRMLGFLGRNGAGKTTTMRAIFGLLRPDSGEVRWHGKAVSRAARALFGYMPEERGLYPKMTCTAQLVYFGRLHGMSAAAATEAAERWLVDLGLEDRQGDKVEELSQGNQQRVQLAVALMHEPEVLVLDEPFNGLDPVAAKLMARVLTERAAAGTTVLFSSHQLDVVEELCEDVAIIHRGRIVMAGEVETLKRQAAHRIVELDLTDERRAAMVAELDGVLGTTFDGRRHRLRVAPDIDIRALLDGGPDDVLDHFVFTTPSLDELFAEVVA